MITPRRLEYSEGGVPFVEHPDEGTEEQRRRVVEEQTAPHPHRSGRALNEIRRAEENLNEGNKSLGREAP